MQISQKSGSEFCENVEMDEHAMNYYNFCLHFALVDVIIRYQIYFDKGEQTMKKLKLLSLLLAVLMLCGIVPLFSSCGKQKDGNVKLSKKTVEVHYYL